jgi:NADPH:quinone reductase-like Zn-dependent oxidoreductase
MATDMQCVIAKKYTKPSGFELGRLPIPQLEEATDVQIEVYAASINPVDLKKASGMLKMALLDECVPPSGCRSRLTWTTGFPTRSATTVRAR